jgi:hypothetical protein
MAAQTGSTDGPPKGTLCQGCRHAMPLPFWPLPLPFWPTDGCSDEVHGRAPKRDTVSGMPSCNALTFLAVALAFLADALALCLADALALTFLAVALAFLADALALTFLGFALLGFAFSFALTLLEPVLDACVTPDGR